VSIDHEIGKGGAARGMEQLRACSQLDEQGGRSLRRSPSRGGVGQSALPLSEPRRYRDRAHLEFVASQPCLLCGRQPCDAHHLRFTQCTPVEVQFTSAGCLNYPCRTPQP
jgi:hypothetical protein